MVQQDVENLIVRFPGTNPKGPDEYAIIKDPTSRLGFGILACTNGHWSRNWAEQVDVDVVAFLLKERNGYPNKEFDSE